MTVVTLIRTPCYWAQFTGMGSKAPCSDLVCQYQASSSRLADVRPDSTYFYHDEPFYQVIPVLTPMSRFHTSDFILTFQRYHFQVLMSVFIFSVPFELDDGTCFRRPGTARFIV
jgi:hypothetical protein